MIKHTPALGWNTWNTFGNNINEALILESADAFVKSGLKDAGYEYVVIDDCWSLKRRDENGRLVPDPEKFPHGMKYVADYVHSKGLKFGMYSCAGALTCAGYPSSYEYEYVDAQTFAEWGVDYLKYDYCFHSSATPGHMLYKRMGLALLNCGRDILFSACSWGADETNIWIKETGANSFRSTGDIIDGWGSVKMLAQDQLRRLEYNGQGCFNDMDMLVCGMRSSGGEGSANSYVLNGGGCNDDEYFTHFALWCMLASPLMIGCDVRSIDETTLKLLTNKDLLRINQDERGCQPFFINNMLRLKKNENRTPSNDFHYLNYPLDVPVLARFLSDGKIAIGAFNFTDGEVAHFNTAFLTESVGVPRSSGKTLRLTDVTDGSVIESVNGAVRLPAIKAHCSRVFIAEVVDEK